MTKRSISLAIRSHQQPGRVLLVQRPDDDDDLPGAWGLPAASLAGDESWEDAARRAGREKLGVDLRIERLLREGELERTAYTLQMRLFEATLAAGEPHVPQAVTGVTQYQAWKWGTAAELRPAAEAGSLCSRLFLASGGKP